MTKPHDKVRKLLAKALGTSNEHEAAAFMAKAQYLMQRHAIDVDKLGRDESAFKTVRYNMGSGTANALNTKCRLMVGIADVNRCSAWSERGYPNYVAVAGHKDDVAFVFELWASIVMQMEAALLDAAPHRPFKVVDDQLKRIHGTTFRNGFYYGYSARVVERLREALDGADTSGKELVSYRGDKAREIRDQQPGLTYEDQLSEVHETSLRFGSYAAGYADISNNAKLGDKQ